MKKLLGTLVLSFIVALALPNVAAAEPPTHGCDQALENDGDVYDSTCDGSASENGNGNGNANGRPCAGCVGAADNKNPPGQLPGPQDNNNGYECDGNNGIAKGNPAHSACEPYSGSSVTSDQRIHGKQASMTTDPVPDRIPLGTFLTLGFIASLLLVGLVKLAYRVKNR